MRIAYPTLFAPRDPNAFGGRMHLAPAALEAAGLELIELRGEDLRQRLARRALWEIGRRRHGPLYNVHRDRRLIRRCGRLLSTRLRAVRPDAVLSVMSPGSQPVAYLDGDVPVVIWTDTTLAGWLETLPAAERSRLPPKNVADGLANERAALERCALVVFWTDWAATAAADHYAKHAGKMRVLPVGPSVECDRDAAAVRRLVARRERDICRLLLVGVGWHRKGADVAVRVAGALVERGIPARLTVVGSMPAEPMPPYVDTVGFIAKASSEGRRRLGELFAAAHFFILPTRHDCSPLVLNEACSYGVPCMASRIAGIPTLVRDGRNGWTLAPDDVQGYCDRIERVFGDAGAYERLALETFREFQTRLSWPVAAAAMADLLRGVAG